MFLFGKASWTVVKVLMFPAYKWNADPSMNGFALVSINTVIGYCGGVELARYRLRKKLELNKKENLIGFLMVI